MKKLLIAAATAAMILPAAAMAERDGATVYNSACTACHASGVAGAPKIGDAAAWSARAALGVDALTATVKTGKGVMPPMGACGNCTDGEIKAAVQYMIDNSK